MPDSTEDCFLHHSALEQWVISMISDAIGLYLQSYGAGWQGFFQLRYFLLAAVRLPFCRLHFFFYKWKLSVSFPFVWCAVGVDCHLVPASLLFLLPLFSFPALWRTMNIKVLGSCSAYICRAGQRKQGVYGGQRGKRRPAVLGTVRQICRVSRHLGRVQWCRKHGGDLSGTLESALEIVWICVFTWTKQYTYLIYTFVQLHPETDSGDHTDVKMSRISPTAEAAVVPTLNTLLAARCVHSRSSNDKFSCFKVVEMSDY